ncbi:MAG: pyridoxal phosphate-dependent aminotransferase [Notoacmeibacter sp.]|nr:pyridoxal phosphate-dependent aminotransferase [Notoacmeibacter sp.]
MSLMDDLRAEARAAPESGIIAIRKHGQNRSGLIPLWVGESDLPTPDFISRAAAQALLAGETFYTAQAGISELREALARYTERHFAQPSRPGEFVVTGSGMQAIQMAINAIAGAGDEVIYLAPSWPNIVAALGIAGIRPRGVDLTYSTGAWELDLDKLSSAITPSTRAMFLNSPSNPTGWAADAATLRSVLDLARRHGLWIIADEIYSLFYYAGKRAPSFMDIMDPEDRIIFVNTFSKNWAMTGWRIGWVRIHPDIAGVFENLVQYSTSGVAQFMQRGAVAALNEGDPFIAEQVDRCNSARDMFCARLMETGRVELAVPQGAFYLFFSIDGVDDSLKAACRIVDDTAVGLAPGMAFGSTFSSSFRVCFNRRRDHLETSATRLAEWIAAL